MFPISIHKFTKDEENVFNRYFAENNEFYFEGMWFRNQRPENKNQSGYLNETTVRRRYIHFYNTYINNKNCLTLKYAYLYVSNTLPKEENEEYISRIYKALTNKEYSKVSDNIWEKEDLQIIINRYNSHPKNDICKTTFPENYNTVDVFVVTKGFDFKPHYDRMWRHSTKLYRNPDKRENPKYISSLEEIKKYLPAQIEMGCGPSIETGINPLHNMHETYKVQNHKTKKFYFSEEDTLIEDLLLDPISSYNEFSKTVVKCIQAKHTQGYEVFNKLYKKGYFVGTVLNNNFDRLVKRYDIPEIILRTYCLDTYIQKINFDKRAKSLICFGTHADRRQVQKQARAAGLKVIYIDPEGFYEKENFTPYLIEGPKDNDLILKMKFEDAMSLFEEALLK